VHVAWDGKGRPLSIVSTPGHRVPRLDGRGRRVLDQLGSSATEARSRRSLPTMSGRWARTTPPPAALVPATTKPAAARPTLAYRTWAGWRQRRQCRHYGAPQAAYLADPRAV